MEEKYGKTLSEALKRCKYVMFSSMPTHEEDFGSEKEWVFYDSRVPEGGTWWVESAKIASFIG